MKLLVTGALRITPEESAELENLGYEIYFMPDERVAVPENIPCEEIEAIICNGLFLYTPPDKFPKLRTVQLTSAGLDRVPMDYMDADSELWDLPNAVITPHNSFVGDGNRARLFSLIINNLK